MAVIVILAAVFVSGCAGSEDSQLPGPPAGATLAVVGVQYDSTLPLRSSPGADQPVAASPGPLADDLVATGRTRQLDSSIWYEVSTGGVTGWADSASLAYLGETYDATERIVAKLGSRPTADSMLELGRIVAMATASTEDPASQVTVAIAPTVQGDLGEVTYDVVGFPDDSVSGERLHTFGMPGDRFTLKTVEATTLCRRGVSDDNQRACV
ncbi:hypothetical protein ACORG1_03930 [Mycobacterium sp. TJFP1]